MTDIATGEVLKKISFAKKLGVLKDAANAKKSFFVTLEYPESVT